MSFPKINKLLIATVLILFYTTELSAQYKWIAVNALHIAYDANGPIGDCLFPMDDEGKITIQDVVKTDYSKDSTIVFVTDFLEKEDDANGISVSIPSLSKLNDVITCDVEMNVGKELVEMPYAGLMERHVSQISFNVKIEVKDGRFRYILSDFYTNRRTIHGEAKSEGPSNLIHWQRVNSLTNERDEYDYRHKRKSKRVKQNLKEWDDQIAKEIKSYEGEYDAVQSFISDLENCCVLKVEKDW